MHQDNIDKLQWMDMNSSFVNLILRPKGKMPVTKIKCNFGLELSFWTMGTLANLQFYGIIYRFCSNENCGKQNICSKFFLLLPISSLQCHRLFICSQRINVYGNFFVIWWFSNNLIDFFFHWLVTLYIAVCLSKEESQVQISCYNNVLVDKMAALRLKTSCCNLLISIIYLLFLKYFKSSTNLL